MADVVRWVDTQEVDEVFDALSAARRALAPSRRCRPSWGRDDRQRSAVYTTAETVVEVFADPAVAASESRAIGDASPASDRPGPVARRARHAVPVRAGPRPASAAPAVRHPGRPRSSRPPTSAPRVRAAARPAAARGARRGRQRGAVGRARRAGVDRGGSRRAARDGVAGPRPTPGPVRHAGRERGEQPPGEGLPVGHRRSGHARARQHAHRRDRAADVGHDRGRHRERRRAPTLRPCADWRRPTPCAGSRPATPSWCRATSRPSASGCARGRTTGSCGPGPRLRARRRRRTGAAPWWRRRSVGTVGP